MTDKHVGYGVSWVGPDVHPETRIVKRQGKNVKIKHSYAGKPIHHSERFGVRGLEKARKLYRSKDKSLKPQICKLTIVGAEFGFPMCFWDEMKNE